MNDEIEALYARWPKILAPDGRKVPLYIEAGWNSLIDELCKQLQHYTDHEDAPQVEAGQIKEKFGGLHFYVGKAHVTQRAAIRFAEGLSYRICETSGAVGQLYVRDYWYSTKCPEHAPEGGKPAVPEDASFRITIYAPADDEGKGVGP